MCLFNLGVLANVHKDDMERDLIKLRAQLNIPSENGLNQRNGVKQPQHSNHTSTSHASDASNKENNMNNDDYEDPLIAEFMRDAKQPSSGAAAKVQKKAGSALAAASGLSDTPVNANGAQLDGYCDDCVGSYIMSLVVTLLISVQEEYGHTLDKCTANDIF